MRRRTSAYLNFRHVANALGIAQSSVSARVKALEEDLGILLFERHARGVRLTEAGRHFVEQIAAGVDQLDHAVNTAGMAAAGEWGRLRIGIYALIPHSFLTELIAQYRKEYPGIEIEITEGTARDAVMQLRADRLDVAFVAGKPELPDCHTRPIWTEPLVAFCRMGIALPENRESLGPIWPARYTLSAMAAPAHRSTTISCCALPGAGPGCKGRTIPMDKLDHLVASHIGDRLLQPKRLETVLASVIDRRQERTERRREHLAELHRRITEADQRLGRLFDAIEAGMVDKDDAMAKDRMASLKASRDQSRC